MYGYFHSKSPWLRVPAHITRRLCSDSSLFLGGSVSWTVGDWNACSVTCGGGSQTRSVQCVSHDASGPRVVEDALCAAYAEAPPSLQTCNMQTCAEYHVTGWSAVSTRIKMILLRKKSKCVDEYFIFITRKV